MKATVYTIEDDYLGILLTIEAELIDHEDNEPPFIVIQEISHNEKPLELWCFKDKFIDHLQNRVFQQWCSEVLRA